MVLVVGSVFSVLANESADHTQDHRGMGWQGSCSGGYRSEQPYKTLGQGVEWKGLCFAYLLGLGIAVLAWKLSPQILCLATRPKPEAKTS
eukprot:6243137-Amphidinium_carterae.1